MTEKKAATKKVVTSKAATSKKSAAKKNEVVINAENVVFFSLKSLLNIF